MAVLECRGMGLIAAFVIHGNCGEGKCRRCKVDSMRGAKDPRHFYAMLRTCVGASGRKDTGIARGQEMLSMPSAKHAFMSLT